MLRHDANQSWTNPGFVAASTTKRVDEGVHCATHLVIADKFEEVARKHDGVLPLGIGTEIEGVPMEGASVMTRSTWTNS